MNTPGYESLANVLQRAYGQAAQGKGAERHACDRPFTEQPMQSISELLGTPDGLLYQAMKKIQESKRLDKDAGVRELLGAINYLAGAVIFIEAGARQPVEKSSTWWACDHRFSTNNILKPPTLGIARDEKCPVCNAFGN